MRKTVPVTKGDVLHEVESSNGGGDMIDEDSKSNLDEYDSGDEMFKRTLQSKIDKK